MIKGEEFKKWLTENSDMGQKSINDNVCRIKRADKILPYNSDDTYLFYLDKQEEFAKLSMYVKSQLRRSVRLYAQFETYRTKE